MKEANLKKQAKHKLSGHWTDIENSVSAGIPDTAVTRNGVLQWIEFKRLYGSVIILRPLQRVFAEREVRNGGDVLFMYYDDGPSVITARSLLNMKPKIKGGKLHYDVVDLEFTIHGWTDIDYTFFRKKYE